MAGARKDPGGQRGGRGCGYLRPYQQALESFGPTFRATLWSTREAQLERFGVIAETIDLAGRSILDAGCGLGDLAAELAARGVAYRSYVGLEALPELVVAATRRGLARAKFLACDFVADERALGRRRDGARPEVIVFSGSLNTLTQAQGERVLERAWRACGEALLFNFLSDRHHEKTPADISPAYRYDPVRMAAWALERTPLVLFRQDYLDGHDATIGMIKAG